MTKPCIFGRCSTPPTQVLRLHDHEVGPICAPHEWLVMSRLRAKLPADEAVAGWEKFCAERGYDPAARDFASATNEGTEDGRST